jgi:hypothetical protein
MFDLPCPKRNVVSIRKRVWVWRRRGQNKVGLGMAAAGKSNCDCNLKTLDLQVRFLQYQVLVPQRNS